MATSIPNIPYSGSHEGNELLQNNPEHLLSVNVSEAEVAFRIEHPESTDSLVANTYRLIYEIEEIEDGKYGIKGYSVIDY